MNIVLIVMLFILFFLTLQGWRKGILGIVYGLVSWIFIFIFVSVANPYILGYLKTETNIYDKVYEQAEKFVTNKAENLPQDTGLEDWYQSLTDAIPGNALGDVTDSIRQMQTNVEQNPQLQDLLNGLQTQNDLTVAQFGGASSILQLSDGTQTLGQMICGKIADFMMQGIAVFIAFVIAQIIVLIVGYLSKVPERHRGSGRSMAFLVWSLGLQKDFWSFGSSCMRLPASVQRHLGRGFLPASIRANS